MSRWSARLRVAMFTALNGSTTRTVYDSAAPEDEGGAYHVVGERTAVPVDTHTDLGTEETVTVHTWVPAGFPNEEGVPEYGSRLAEEAMGEVDELLHHEVLTLPGGGTVELVKELDELLLDESEPGETWHHGVQRFRAKTLEPVP